MLVKRKWTRYKIRKLPRSDSKWYVAHYKGLFLFGIIPLYIERTEWI
jgi:hypothetical protein